MKPAEQPHTSSVHQAGQGGGANVNAKAAAANAKVAGSRYGGLLAMGALVGYYLYKKRQMNKYPDQHEANKIHMRQF